jgi:hypothetical protein
MSDVTTPHMGDERLRHRAYTRDVGDDSPDVRNWAWPSGAPSGTGPPAAPRQRCSCVRAREDLEIARGVREVLGSRGRESLAQ